MATGGLRAGSGAPATSQGHTSRTAEGAQAAYTPYLPSQSGGRVGRPAHTLGPYRHKREARTRHARKNTWHLSRDAGKEGGQRAVQPAASATSSLSITPEAYAAEPSKHRGSDDIQEGSIARPTPEPLAARHEQKVGPSHFYAGSQGPGARGGAANLPKASINSGDAHLIVAGPSVPRAGTKHRFASKALRAAPSVAPVQAGSWRPATQAQKVWSRAADGQLQLAKQSLQKKGALAAFLAAQPSPTLHKLAVLQNVAGLKPPALVRKGRYRLVAGMPAQRQPGHTAPAASAMRPAAACCPMPVPTPSATAGQQPCAPLKVLAVQPAHSTRKMPAGYQRSRSGFSLQRRHTGSPTTLVRVPGYQATRKHGPCFWRRLTAATATVLILQLPQRLPPWRVVYFVSCHGPSKALYPFVMHTPLLPYTSEWQHTSATWPLRCCMQYGTLCRIGSSAFATAVGQVSGRTAEHCEAQCGSIRGQAGSTTCTDAAVFFLDPEGRAEAATCKHSLHQGLCPSSAQGGLSSVPAACGDP